MKEQFKYKFIINYGIMEHKVDLMVFIYSDSLLKAVEKIINFYFRCKIKKCFRVVGSNEFEITELSNIECYSSANIKNQILLQAAKNYNRKRKQQLKK